METTVWQSTSRQPVIGAERLDVPRRHRFGERRRFQKVQGVGGIQGAPAHLADAMPGAADALQGRGHRGRRLHEHHLVQVADVDAEFQGTRGDDGAEFARFQALLPPPRSDVPGQASRDGRKPAPRAGLR